LRVFFVGPILGIEAGTREGLPTAWMKEEGQWVYDLAPDTAEKVLLARIISQ
jgi:UDP-N-acetyl-D-mannosaminuronic acid transferase (WecB/TagA/CpsF family)